MTRMAGVVISYKYSCTPVIQVVYVTIFGLTFRHNRNSTGILQNIPINAEKLLILIIHILHENHSHFQVEHRNLRLTLRALTRSMRLKRLAGIVR